VRVVGGIALTVVLYAPMLIVFALLGQVFLGAWWIGVAIIALWSLTMRGLARIARRRGWDGQRWLDALAKGLAAHSGGWRDKA
jgi:hypothetical protein